MSSGDVLRCVHPACREGDRQPEAARFLPVMLIWRKVTPEALRDEESAHRMTLYLPVCPAHRVGDVSQYVRSEKAWHDLEAELLMRDLKAVDRQSARITFVDISSVRPEVLDELRKRTAH